MHKLASLYDIAIVMTTSVGVIVGGPYEGKKMVGCSFAVNRDGIFKQAGLASYLMLFLLDALDGHAIAVPERSYPRHHDDGDDRNRFFSDGTWNPSSKSFGAAMQINSGLRPILSLP